jgi:hypothetical protein
MKDLKYKINEVKETLILLKGWWRLAGWATATNATSTWWSNLWAVTVKSRGSELTEQKV